MIQLPQEKKSLSEVGEGALVSLQFDLGLLCEVFFSLRGLDVFVLFGWGDSPFTSPPQSKAKKKKEKQMKHLNARFSTRAV